jgi:hypothetical protein
MIAHVLFPHLIVCLFALTLFCANGISQEVRSNSTTNWPTIRGAAFDGHSSEKELADRWPAEGPPVLWSRELGQGYSAFIAWDQCVATQYQHLSGQYLICMEADADNEDEAEDAHETLVSTVLDVLFSDPTLKGVVQTLTLASIQYQLISSSDDQLMHTAEISVTVETVTRSSCKYGCTC